jgi:hypothetical protein
MKRIAVLAASLVACGSAHAIGIGVKAGTTGIGIDAAMSVFPLVDARIGWSGLKWGYDQNTSNVSYKGDLKLNNLNALLDFHPMGPLFRLTGGVVFNSNKYDATGTPNSGPGSFNATVEAGRSTAPYLGIGWGRVAGMGVNWYADLGAMFMGEPKATLTANCTGLSAPQCTALQSQVAAEQTSLQDSLKRFKVYPVLNIGVTIGF